MSIADGKEKRPRIPANIPSTTLELVVKMTLGGDLTAFPADRELDASGRPCEHLHLLEEQGRDCTLIAHQRLPSL